MESLGLIPHSISMQMGRFIFSVHSVKQNWLTLMHINTITLWNPWGWSPIVFLCKWEDHLFSTQCKTKMTHPNAHKHNYTLESPGLIPNTISMQMWGIHLFSTPYTVKQKWLTLMHINTITIWNPWGWSTNTIYMQMGKIHLFSTPYTVKQTHQNMCEILTGYSINCVTDLHIEKHNLLCTIISIWSNFF